MALEWPLVSKQALSRPVLAGNIGCYFKELKIVLGA